MLREDPSVRALPKLVGENGNDWGNIKKKFIHTEGDNWTMRLLLAYRRHEFERIFGLVMDQMERAHKNDVGRKKFTRDMLKLSLPGSADLTSDVDATFDHPPDKPWVSE